jgi:glyoxylase-like metal-dependent hydrolase (beta-lactamase superfamily II)
MKKGVEMKVKEFFDKDTSTLTYVVYDEKTKDAVIIDPVLDYEPQGSNISSASVDELVDFVKQESLRPLYILETHAHADHLSASQILKERFPGIQLAIGKRIQEVQKMFKNIFDLPSDFPTDGSQFDLLLNEGDVLQAGSLRFETLFTPGHTPACATYRIENSVFVGDALFMPDSGTGRCDFPGGSAKDLYHSIQKLYKLPDNTLVYVGHDYQPGGREMEFKSTIGEEKKKNIQIQDTTPENDYIKFRTARDKTLAAPRLLFQSVQVNVDAGKIPEPKSNEIRYLKIPINIFKPQYKLSPNGDVVLE